MSEIPPLAPCYWWRSARLSEAVVDSVIGYGNGRLVKKTQDPRYQNEGEKCPQTRSTVEST